MVCSEGGKEQSESCLSMMVTTKSKHAQRIALAQGLIAEIGVAIFQINGILFITR